MIYSQMVVERARAMKRDYPKRSSNHIAQSLSRELKIDPPLNMWTVRYWLDGRSRVKPV